MKDGLIQSRETRLSEQLMVHYLESGQGEVLVLIPGWTMTAQMFARNIEALSESYRVIAYDPRSQGQSTYTETHNNYYQHGRDLNDFLGSLGLSDIVLAGWSMGCITALSYINQFGHDKIRALINIDACPRPARLDEEGWGVGPKEEVRKIQAAITAPDQSEFIQRYARYGFLKSAASDDFVDFICSQSMCTPATAAALLLADGNLCDYTGTARRLDQEMPVLHIVSEHTVPDASKWISANMPNSTVLGLGSHMMFWEFPDKFNGIVNGFLGNL